MLEKQPSSQQKRAHSSRQTAEQKLGEYKKLLQNMHNLLLTEEMKLQEIVRDEQMIPTFKKNLSAILAWIKKVENNGKIIGSFHNISGNEIEIFKENIEHAIIHVDVALDVLAQEKQALEQMQVRYFAELRVQVYTSLVECRKCISKALLLFKNT